MSNNHSPPSPVPPAAQAPYPAHPAPHPAPATREGRVEKEEEATTVSPRRKPSLGLIALIGGGTAAAVGLALTILRKPAPAKKRGGKKQGKVSSKRSQAAKKEATANKS